MREATCVMGLPQVWQGGTWKRGLRRRSTKVATCPESVAAGSEGMGSLWMRRQYTSSLSVVKHAARDLGAPGVALAAGVMATCNVCRRDMKPRRFVCGPVRRCQGRGNLFP